MYSVIGILGIRGILNAIIPLMDKTEARYAEIARIMAETGNWITPQIDYGVPFWAKPPLSTWLSALFFKLFTVNEFFARFPSLLLTGVLVLMIGKHAKKRGLPFFLPGLIILTIPEFLVHAGVVSTDVSLTFAIALVMLSFWETMQENAKVYWQYLVFLGFGLGLIAKGPIVFILTIPPILGWILIFKQHKIVFNRIALLKGFIITLVIGVPWYIFAEKATSGFIDYFVIGEHFKRFFDSNWVGDKYGFPKSQPIGMIWVFLVLFTFPWILILIKNLWKERVYIIKNKWIAFLCLWLLWTPLFFTVSKSLIHPYIMPVIMPIALLITYFWAKTKLELLCLKFGVLIPVLALLLSTYASFQGKLSYYNTDKLFFNEKLTQRNQVFHLNKKSYSSQFYSNGAIKSIELQSVKELLSSKKSFLILISKKDYLKIPHDVKQQLVLITSNHKKGMYRYKIQP